MKLVYLCSLSVLLIACASTEKPHYLLSDGEILQYQGGDSLTYSVLSIGTTNDSIGQLTQTYSTIDLLTPQREVFTAFSQTTSVQGDIYFNFATPNISQSESGEITLHAFTESAKTYWLANSETENLAVSLYPSPITDLTDTNSSGTINLLVCENNSCQDSGNTSFTITPSLSNGAFETVDTKYALFDTYKFQIVWSVTIASDDQSAPLKTWKLTGEQWIYPPLGVVKFIYTIVSENTSDTLIGDLTSTNINIPDDNKAM